jgi:iron complex outermembrane receptor protein
MIKASIKLSMALVAALTGQMAFGQSSLDEIVVTAQKRETTLHETPIAISAFSSEQLQLAGIDTVDTLAQSVPNMVVGGNNNNAFVMIRGIGTSNFSVISDPSVAVHLDDLYITRLSGMNMLMYDTERVEVLRGPQGTIYGRNANGGSVNIISNKPEQEFGGNADVLFGDYNWWQTRAVLNVPISEGKLAARLSAVREKRDGFQENVFPGGTVAQDRDALAWRAQLLWTPAENLDILLKVDDVDFDDTGTSRERLDSPAGHPSNDWQGTLADPQALNSVYKDFPESRVLESSNKLIRANWGLGDSVELSLISGWTDLDWAITVDAEQDRELLNADVWGEMSSESNSQELRLASTGDGRLQWVAGYYQLHEEAVNTVLIMQTPGVTIDNLFAVENDVKAVYGQLSYAISDSFRLTAGARSGKDEKAGYAENEVCVTFTPICFAPFNTDEADDEWSETSWLLGMDWTLADGHMLYGKVSTGYKSGGFNLGEDFFDSNTVWDPEEILAYEFGWKALLFDNKLQVNTAAFLYDYTDLQLNSILNFTIFTENASEATVQGVEVELAYRPSDQAIIDFGIGWLDATFDNYVSVDPVNVPRFPVPPPPVSEDFSGNHLVNAPELSMNLGLQYTFELGSRGSLTARSQTRFQSHWYLRPYNIAEDRQESFTKTDLRLIWRSPDQTWYTEAFVTNVSNVQRATSVEMSNGAFFGNVFEPRMWGVRVGIDF